MSSGEAGDIKWLQQQVAGLAETTGRPTTTEAVDPLADAIVALAAHHHNRLSRSQVTAALPLEGGRLPLAHLEAAGRQAGLRIEAFGSRTAKLAMHHLPALAVARNGAVALIERIRPDGSIEARSIGSSEGARTLTRREAARELARIYLAAPMTADARQEPIDIVNGTPISGNRALFAQAIIATLLVNLLALALPLYTMNVYDRALPNGTLTTLVALSIGAAMAGVFDLILKGLRQVLVDTASRRSDMQLSMSVFARVTGAKLPARSSAVGAQVNTVREIETLRELRASMTLTAFADIPFALLFVAVIAIVGGWLAIVPIVMLPLVLLAVLATQRPLARLSEGATRRAATKNAVLVETLGGMETIKSIGAESWAAARWERSFAEHLRLSNAMRFYSTLGLNIVGFAQTVATIAMIVLGFFLVSSGHTTAGALMASMMLLSRALAPLSQIAGLASRLQQGRSAREALKQMVSAPQERSADADLVVPHRMVGRIEFESVRFAYEPMAPATLSDLDLVIEPGERVAIIGAIGSGKSTLLRLLAKLHTPAEGRIRVDGIGLGALDPVWLRAQIGYLGQEAMLFQGSIRENLLMHRMQAGDAAMIEAARTAGALDWIGNLSKGFATEIGERGQGLSGGQKRSLALTRALVGGPKLLLLDEPTSEMDAGSEAKVIQGLKSMLPGRTLIVVTHKPALLDLVDRLVVIEKGRIVADGPKTYVLERLKQGQVRAPAAAPKPKAPPTEGASHSVALAQLIRGAAV